MLKKNQQNELAKKEQEQESLSQNIQATDENNTFQYTENRINLKMKTATQKIHNLHFKIVNRRKNR